MDELMQVLAEVTDKMANSEMGHKMMDDVASVIGRFYGKLLAEGLSPEAAAMVCANLGANLGGRN